VVSDGSLALSGILAERAGSAIHAYRKRTAFELPTIDWTWVRLVDMRI